jgi:hypothetical protein
MRTEPFQGFFLGGVANRHTDFAIRITINPLRTNLDGKEVHFVFVIVSLRPRLFGCVFDCLDFLTLAADENRAAIRTHFHINCVFSA